MRWLVLILCFGLLSAEAALTDESYSDNKVSFRIANHISASVQAKIFHNGMHYRDIYISPYYFSELVEVPEGTYTLEVYDVSDNFLGYIEETKLRGAYDNGSSLISISRFGLKPAISTKLSYPDLKDLAERMDLNKLAAQAATKPAVVVVAKPSAAVEEQPVIARKLKLANLTNYLLYIEVHAINGAALISPRFMANDAYSPELLQEADSILLFPVDASLSLKAFNATEAEVRECLSHEVCDKILKSFSIKLSDLRIDDNDNYIWVIDELP